MDRSNALFIGGKYSASDYFCYMEFSVYFTIDIKPDYSSEYQPDESQTKLTEEIPEECGYP